MKNILFWGGKFGHGYDAVGRFPFNLSNRSNQSIGISNNRNRTRVAELHTFNPFSLSWDRGSAQV